MKIWLTLSTVVIFSTSSFATDRFFTLVEPSSARATAMGESFTAMQNDIAAFHYNPASLSSLESKQASFLFEKKVEQERYSNLSIGLPEKQFTLGSSLAYYDTGSVLLYDGESSKYVTGQRDMVFSLGASKRWGPLSAGFKPKLISSEFAGIKKTQIWALDGGLMLNTAPRLWTGVSILNTRLAGDDENDLPRAFQTGLFYSSAKHGDFAVDLKHIKNESIIPSIGYECGLGVLTLRAGYKLQKDSNALSLGTGLQLNQFQLHYAANFVASRDLRHLFSMSYSFGDRDAASAYSNPSDPVFQKDQFDSLEILKRDSKK